jgi:hypothetical protein
MSNSTFDVIRKSFAWDVYSPAGDAIRDSLVEKLGDDAGKSLWYAYLSACNDAAGRGSDYANDAGKLAERLTHDAASIRDKGVTAEFGWIGGTHEVAGVESRRTQFLADRHRAYDLETAIKAVLGDAA